MLFEIWIAYESKIDIIFNFVSKILFNVKK